MSIMTMLGIMALADLLQWVILEPRFAAATPEMTLPALPALPTNPNTAVLPSPPIPTLFFLSCPGPKGGRGEGPSVPGYQRAGRPITCTRRSVNSVRQHWPRTDVGLAVLKREIADRNRPTIVQLHDGTTAQLRTMAILHGRGFAETTCFHISFLMPGCSGTRSPRHSRAPATFQSAELESKEE